MKNKEIINDVFVLQKEALFSLKDNQSPQTKQTYDGVKKVRSYGENPTSFGADKTADILKKIEEVLEVLDEKCSREDAESRGMEKEWDEVQKLKEVKEIFKENLKNEKS